MFSNLINKLKAKKKQLQSLKVDDIEVPDLEEKKNSYKLSRWNISNWNRRLYFSYWLCENGGFKRRISHFKLDLY